MEKYTKNDLVQYVRQRTKLSLPHSQQIVDVVTDGIKELLNEEQVKLVIQNFGTFETRTQGPSVRRNPRTGEKVRVPEKRKVILKMSKNFFPEEN